MSPAVMPPIIPIAIIAKRNSIIRHFTKAAAYTPETAQTLEALNLTSSHIFRRMLKDGVLKEVPENRFYLDQTANAEFHRRTRLGVAVALGVVAVIVGVVLLVR